MKKFYKRLIGGMSGFFGILILIGFYNDSYVELKKTLSDGSSWMVIGTVIVFSCGVKLYKKWKRYEPDIQSGRNRIQPRKDSSCHTSHSKSKVE